MIYELATVDVVPGQEDAFENGVRQARPLFEAAQGFCSFALQRSIEQPSRYRLMVGWETVDNHMVDFRNSPSFGRWRELVGPCFTAPPAVEHVQMVDVG